MVMQRQGLARARRRARQLCSRRSGQDSTGMRLQKLLAADQHGCILVYPGVTSALLAAGQSFADLMEMIARHRVGDRGELKIGDANPRYCSPFLSAFV